MVLSSSALGAVVSAHGGKLGVGFGHESLQLLFEQLVSRLGCSRLHRSGTLGTALIAAFAGLKTTFPAECTIGRCSTEIAAVPTGRILANRLGLQTLDGQVDLAVFIADDNDFDILTLSQMGADITDIGVSDFRDMYHTGLILRQGNECAKISNGLDFSFQNSSNG